MFDMILENYRKATESTMKLQQDMLRNWTMQWPQMFGAQTFGFPLTGGPDRWHPRCREPPGSSSSSDAQKKWAETVTEMLNKHRESLDAQYKAGIRTIEEAFKVGEAKDPAAVPPPDRGALEAELRVPQDRGRVADARRPGRDAEVVRGRVQDRVGHEGLTHTAASGR